MLTCSCGSCSATSVAPSVGLAAAGDRAAAVPGLAAPRVQHEPVPANMTTAERELLSAESHQPSM